MSYIDNVKCSVIITQGASVGEGTLKHLNSVLTDLDVYNIKTKLIKGDDQDVKLDFTAPAGTIFVDYMNVLYGKLGVGAEKNELEQFVEFIERAASQFTYERLVASIKS